MKTRRARIGSILLVLLLLAGFAAPDVIAPTTAAAHGGTKLTVQPLVAAAGQEVTVSGDGFDKDAEIEIAIEGAAGSTALGSVLSDDEGDFEQSFALPLDLPAGAYSVTASGPEKNARTDVTVVASAGGTAPAAEGAEAHDEETLTGRPYGAGELAGLSLAIAAVIGAGVGLIAWGAWRSKSPQAPVS